MDAFHELKNILFIDIETVSCQPHYGLLESRLKGLWDRKAKFLANDLMLSNDELFFERAGIYAEFGKVVSIATGIYCLENGELSLRVKGISSPDEKDLLLQFKNLLESKFDPLKTCLCAHNGKEFDYPFLCRRFLVNCIPVPQIFDMQGKKPWEVNHLDTMEMWKFGDKKNYTSLDLLAAIFNIESSKGEMDGSLVNHTYYIEKDLKKINEYCMQDVVVTAQLYLKYKCLPTVKKENIQFVGERA